MRPRGDVLAKCLWAKGALAACALATVLTAMSTTGCGSAPGQPAENSAVVPPSKILDFEFLYARNCAGCHGKDGKGGAAAALANPVYLAIADDAVIGRVTADGVPGTTMPAFAQHSGGMLTDGQINAIVQGMRARWSKPDALHGATAPPYAASAPGNAEHGAAAFGTYCASCHGEGGHGGKASSIVDGAYLTLVSDQGLRTTVIAGRPELGSPDWRGDATGKPMSPAEVSDVVAWLAAQRPQPASARNAPQNSMPESTATPKHGGNR